MQKQGFLKKQIQNVVADVVVGISKAYNDTMPPKCTLILHQPKRPKKVKKEDKSCF